MWTPYFRTMSFHSMGVTHFKKNRHLFLFYFFKGKQNKKENYKYDSLFGKTVCKKPIMTHRSKASHDNE